LLNNQRKKGVWVAGEAYLGEHEKVKVRRVGQEPGFWREGEALSDLKGAKSTDQV